jgi:hypothetical protein
MTPRGLKIRLGLDWAFTLIARLWQKDSRTDAFRVLKTVEAIEHVPTVLAFAGSIIAALVPSWPIWSVAIGAIVGKLIGVLLTHSGMFIVLRPLGIMLLARVWSYLPGFGELHIVAMVALCFVRGWWLIPAWLVGHFGGAILRQVLDFLSAMGYHKLVGQPLTPSEINFFNAYRLHADRLGMTRDIDASDTEIEQGGWYACLADYAEKWPEAVARFPLTLEDRELLSRAERIEV